MELLEKLHHIACRTACEEFLTHIIHIRSNVLEEDLIACAKIVKTWLAIGRLEEAQAGTLAVTSFEPPALTTLTGKGFLLHSAESVLLGAIEHLRQAVRAYVT